MTFETEIQRIPCLVTVTHYRPAVPAVVSGLPEGCRAGERAYAEYSVQHVDGSPAPEIERVITSDDDAAVQSEIDARMAEEADEAAEDEFFETQACRDDLADRAEDLWLRKRGY
ncbi:hypothetical protein [Castellaniella caeni]|uniref:hypothetical protein n=1 Tax=Castellaniella caeni TaxID=266123 RepID=UPI000C9F4241|nr:hypothetical protein [Castellaniella caeni]